MSILCKLDKILGSFYSWQVFEYGPSSSDTKSCSRRKWISLILNWNCLIFYINEMHQQFKLNFSQFNLDFFGSFVLRKRLDGSGRKKFFGKFD